MLLILGIGLLYFQFAYTLERWEFQKLIGYYTALWILSYATIYFLKEKPKLLFVLSILFRLLFLVALPHLSQDYFRFIWDGKMILSGLNPYLSSPSEWIASGSLPFATAEKLIEGMGSLSAGNYTSYPPINQLCFVLGGLFSSSILGNVMVMRLLIILADMGTYWYGKKLLSALHLPSHNLFYYLLNPLIIIELTGNLHFEGVMLFFVVAALYFLQKGKWLISAVLLGLSVSVKVLPLLFLPFIWPYLSELKNKEFPSFNLKNLRPTLNYYALVLITIVLTLLPFLSLKSITHFGQSIGLWFQRFEFNGGVYYIFREAGYLLVYNNINRVYGAVFPLVVIFFILKRLWSSDNRNLANIIVSLLLSVSLYFMLSTTVHPWYIATPLLLSVFTKYRFALLWSVVVMWSYSAYGKEGFSEAVGIVIAEFLLVIGYALYEIFFQKTETTTLKT